MRLTFIHDHKFVFDNGHYYSSGKFSKQMLERYMVGPVSEIQFIGRVQENLYDISSLSVTSSDNIKVNPMKFLKRKSHFITKKRAIKSFLRNNISDKDVVVIRLPSEIGYIAAEIMEEGNIPYGIELVGDPWDALWFHGSLIGKLMAFTNKNKVKKSLKKSKNNIYVTREYLQKRYPSKGSNFIASNVFINQIRKDYQVYDRTVKKIGLIGSLDTKYKGIDTALKSLSIVESNFVFEIVGNGPKDKWQRKINKRGLKDKVQLKGTLKNGNMVNEWLSSLDLYIQPSYTEGLPRALIEAMSNGVPCLGSQAGGIPELLDKKYIHEIKDFKSFAKQIDKVLNNKNLREEMSLENILKANNYLSKNIQAERERFIKSIYEESQYYGT
ncbi:glycosyltransferase family 4 protein [Salinicoccus cyprini]|uniref:Glycosyltransferase family 4 protein n=1 Tax=Salinicoccus cyprini TaxID=2493691 RepID=A0A558AXC3_9STAP|nr:glycosyltransferase [Salinicoccus cyprini]TVT28914.1 glycosyltransferase family 4 protein [Salinicoccus cyprini]